MTIMILTYLQVHLQKVQEQSSIFQAGEDGTDINEQFHQCKSDSGDLGSQSRLMVTFRWYKW